MENTPEEFIFKLESAWKQWQGERGRFIKGNPGRRKRKLVSKEVKELMDMMRDFDCGYIPREKRQRWLALFVNPKLSIMKAFLREAPHVYYYFIEMFVLNHCDPTRPGEEIRYTVRG